MRTHTSRFVLHHFVSNLHSLDSISHSFCRVCYVDVHNYSHIFDFLDSFHLYTFFVSLPLLCHINTPDSCSSYELPIFLAFNHILIFSFPFLFRSLSDFIFKVFANLPALFSPDHAVFSYPFLSFLIVFSSNRGSSFHFLVLFLFISLSIFLHQFRRTREKTNDLNIHLCELELPQAHEKIFASIFLRQPLLHLDL